jgi:hypothetical protein
MLKDVSDPTERAVFPFFGLLPLVMVALVILDAAWIWFGSWRLKFDETNVYVQISFFNRLWKYEYPKFALANLRVDVLKAKGKITGRRIVADYRKKRVTLVYSVTENEGRQLVAQFRAMGIG